MNILFFSHSFYPKIGGIETVSMQLAMNFQERENVSVIVVSRTKEEGKLALPFKVVRDPSTRTVASLLTWCDVVFENHPCYGMSWLNFIIRKPKVVALHTWIGELGKKDNLQQKLKKKLLSDYNAAIACSAKIRDYTFKKALVIENAYNTTLFKNTGGVRSHDFVFVGRLVSDKGGDMCVELLNELNKRQDQRYSLTIIGNGNELDNLKKLVADYTLEEQVRFLGFLDSVAIAKELNEHKYLLVPSRWEEPFGIVVLEGIACGCIPIVSDGGGLPDAVGQAGVLFKRNSISSLVECTMQLLENEEHQSSLLGAAEAHLSLHTEKIVCQQYFDVILNAIQ